MNHWIAPIAVALLALPACAESGEIVGPEGGTVTSDDGMLVLDLMENALDEDVEISIAVSECKGVIGSCYDVSPAGTPLNIPAFVTLELDDAQLDDDDLEDLAIVVSHGKKWKSLTDRFVDEDAGTISGTTVYLSTFAIVERD